MQSVNIILFKFGYDIHENTHYTLIIVFLIFNTN